MHYILWSTTFHSGIKSTVSIIILNISSETSGHSQLEMNRKETQKDKDGSKIQRVRDGIGKNLLCCLLVGSTEQPVSCAAIDSAVWLMKLLPEGGIHKCLLPLSVATCWCTQCSEGHVTERVSFFFSSFYLIEIELKKCRGCNKCVKMNIHLYFNLSQSSIVFGTLPQSLLLKIKLWWVHCLSHHLSDWSNAADSPLTFRILKGTY